MSEARKHAVLGRLIKITPVAGRNAYALTIDVPEQDHDVLAELFPLPSIAHAFDVCVFKPTTEVQKAITTSAASDEPIPLAKWHLSNHIGRRCTEPTGMGTWMRADPLDVAREANAASPAPGPEHAGEVERALELCHALIRDEFKEDNPETGEIIEREARPAWAAVCSALAALRAARAPGDERDGWREVERLRGVLRALDACIFHDPQVVERAGQFRAIIGEALGAAPSPSLSPDALREVREALTAFGSLIAAYEGERKGPTPLSCSAREARELLAARTVLPRPLAPAGEVPEELRTGCYDCKRPYGDEHGFPDLVIPFDTWRRITPTEDDGGLLCPSCICKRLHGAGLRCEGAFMSGPIISVSTDHMHLLRRVENIEVGIEGRDNKVGEDLAARVRALLSNQEPSRG